MIDITLIWMLVTLVFVLMCIVSARRGREHRSIVSRGVLHHSNGTLDDDMTIRNDLLFRAMAKRQSARA